MERQERFIFEGFNRCTQNLSKSEPLVGGIDSSIYNSQKLDKNRVAPSITLQVAWFDGASQRGICGCGVVIVMDIHSHHILSWHRGLGTNTRAKTMSLWGLFWFISEKGGHNINIYGDSKCLIGGILGLHTFDPPLLAGWIMKIQQLTTLSSYSIQHVFREFDMEANQLSKQGLHGRYG